MQLKYHRRRQQQYISKCHKQIPRVKQLIIGDALPVNISRFQQQGFPLSVVCPYLPPGITREISYSSYLYKKKKGWAGGGGGGWGVEGGTAATSFQIPERACPFTRSNYVIYIGQIIKKERKKYIKI